MSTTENEPPDSPEPPAEPGFFARRPHALPAMIAAAMLFIAVGNWPYGYYQVMRLVVCATAAYVGFLCYKWQRLMLIWPMVVLVLLFNPVAPVHLKRETWAVLDVVAAVVMLAAAAVPARKEVGDV